MKPKEGDRVAITEDLKIGPNVESQKGTVTKGTEGTLEEDGMDIMLDRVRLDTPLVTPSGHRYETIPVSKSKISKVD